MAFRRRRRVGVKVLRLSVGPTGGLSTRPTGPKSKKNKSKPKKELEIITLNHHDPAVAVWDLLRPFHLEEKTIQVVLDCINREGFFKQNFDDSNNDSIPDNLKLSIAKLVLQTCHSDRPKKHTIQEIFNRLTNLKFDDKIEDDSEKSKVIRPTFKERYEAKILKSENQLDGTKFVNYDIPQRVINQYSALRIEQRLLSKLLRPQVYFDVSVKSDHLGFSYMGRIVFQLFAEACPALVLELVRACYTKRFRNMSIRKVFKNIWMEVEFRSNNCPLSDGKVLAMSNCSLDHTIGPGILSFSKKITCQSVNRSMINFIVSFSALKILPTQPRIPFGVVHRGHFILREIQKFATCYGKPTRVIKISNCGAINV